MCSLYSSANGICSSCTCCSHCQATTFIIALTVAREPMSSSPASWPGSSVLKVSANTENTSIIIVTLLSEQHERHKTCWFDWQHAPHWFSGSHHDISLAYL